MTFKEKVEKLFTYLPPSLDSVKNNLDFGFKTGYEPYIQHIPEMIDEIQEIFLELCVKEGILPDSFLKGKAHRQGAIGRYLDDSGSVGRYLDDSGSSVYKYWCRFMCIDEKYREWQNPYCAYLATHYEKEDMNGVFIGFCINNLSSDLVTFFREHKINSIINGKMSKTP